MAVRGYKDARGRQRYAVEFEQAGNRVHRRAPPGVTYAQAKEWEVTLRREIFDTGELGKQPDILLSEAIQAWLDTKPQKHHRDLVNKANALAPFVKGRTLREAPEVAAEAVKMWSATHSRMAKGAACADAGTGALGHATINRRLCILKAAAKHAWKQGKIDENLSGKISLLREQNGREVYLTKAQVLKLAKCAPSQAARSAVMVAAYTGLRAAELLALRSPPSTSASSLQISKSKTGKPRTVPVPLPARPYLRALPLGLSYWQLHKEFSAARERAGMPHVHFHDLRHTCASWLINAGVDLYTVGAILGHSGPQTTARYAHLAQKTLRKAMARLK